MRIAGQITVQAPRERVFEALRDAQFFASCVDGVCNLTETGGTHYVAVLETKIAYIKFRFNVDVELARIEPPALIEARITGAPVGIIGRLTSTSITELHENGNETVIDYTTDSSLTGRLGSMGQPVLKSKAREMEREFTKRLRAAFAPQELVGGTQ